MTGRRLVRTGRLNPGEPLIPESHGRRTAGSTPLKLTPEETARVSRTVRRVPEVVVKVSGGGRETAAVRAHFAYIDRHGRLPIETDRGPVEADKANSQRMVERFNLDLTDDRQIGGEARSSKLVHNIVLSMPAKVPPVKVLAAARVFAREQFALAHRYAMVLHTDTRHPHVHLVVKARREDGLGRLNIRKATLRQWREDFARCLREQGLEANATPAVERGAMRSRPKPTMFWAERRARVARAAGLRAEGSRVLREKLRAAHEALRNATSASHPGEARLARTRAEVLAKWQRVIEALRSNGEVTLARQAREFASRLPRPMTDQQRLVQFLREELGQRRRGRGEDEPPNQGAR